jgi:hypothetical protein
VGFQNNEATAAAEGNGSRRIPADTFFVLVSLLGFSKEGLPRKAAKLIFGCVLSPGNKYWKLTDPR